jgi:hypothetical protein
MRESPMPFRQKNTSHFTMSIGSLVVAWIGEKITTGSIQHATVIGGVVAIAVSGLQIIRFGSEWWLDGDRSHSCNAVFLIRTHVLS